MRRDINQVRQALAKRKTEKLKAIKSRSMSRPIKSATSKIQTKDKQSEQKTPVFVKQLIASGFIFLAVLFINQFITPASQWVTNQLREDFPFASVHVWYQEQFGSPLGFFIENEPVPVSNQVAVPVSGIVNSAYDLKGQGVMIEASDQPEVYAIDQGTVLFAGNDRKTNKTVVIQHPDRTKSTYGFLAEINVRPYQFIQANQEIGVSSSETPVYFSLQKGSVYLDPVEVISIDEME